MSGRPDHHLWTPEEDAQLRTLLPQGLSYAQIGERMGMTANQIIGRRARLKLRKAACRFNEHSWTPEQHARMCTLLGEGLSTSEVGRRMGMTKNAIIGRCDRSGMCRRATHHRWTAQEHARLWELLCEGLTHRQIAGHLEMTKSAISGRCYRYRLGIPRHDRPPTTMEQMQILNDRMDALNAESDAIPRLPVPKKSNTGRSGTRQGDGFGVRALGRGQNGSRAVRALEGIFG